MTFQRHLCGGIGLLLLTAGGALYANESTNVVLTAGLLRAGYLLVVTWLAWPQLEKHRRSIPQAVFLAAIALAVVLVVRPSWGKIAGLAVAIVIGVSIVARWFSLLKSKR